MIKPSFLSARRCTTFALAAAFFLSLLPLSSPASAQAWPEKPVRIVVPFAAGGATDAIARMIGDQLSRRLDVPVIIDNKPGASTIIGMDTVAKAPADGYTILVAGVGSFAVLPGLRSKLPFDVEKDLASVALVIYAPVVIATSIDKPYHTLADVIAAAKAHPNTIRYSSYGPGSAPHLAGELLASAAGVTFEAVPYKGAADASIALLRGEVDIGFETLSAVRSQIKAGKLRALAMDGERRSHFLPDVPGLGELDLGRAAMDAYYGVMVPAATPAAIRTRLTNEITQIMAMPDVRERAKQMFLEPVAMDAQSMADTVKADTAKFKVLKQRLKLSLD